MKTCIAVVAGAAGASWFRSRREGAAEAAGWFSKTSTAPAFSTEQFQAYKLIAITPDTHDVKHFRFALHDSNTPLNLPIASCLSLRYTDADGKAVERPYTPINLSSDKGHFDLAVKRYPNSKMGCHLFNMKVGDTIEVKGPWQTLAIAPSQYTHIGMLAGGTGITPMYQTIVNLLSNKSNTTKMSLVFANKTSEDMMMKKELDDLASRHKDKFTLHHCLTQAPANWTGYSGYINKAMIKETMPGPEQKDKIRILVSGPPPFMQAICGAKDYSSMPPKQGKLGGYLKEMGYDESCVYKF